MKVKNKQITEEEYTIEYNKYLSNFNAKTVYDKLCNLVNGEPVLLCYEKSGEFCHRHLVAKWLEENLKIEIKEVN